VVAFKKCLKCYTYLERYQTQVGIYPSLILYAFVKEYQEVFNIQLISGFRANNFKNYAELQIVMPEKVHSYILNFSFSVLFYM
jgi:hypothetical protein